MSTGGPDPNRQDPPDPDTARGDAGNSSVSRFGMPTLITGLLVFAIAVAFVLYAILSGHRTIAR